MNPLGEARHLVECFGIVEGTFDLVPYLEQADGRPPRDLDPIRVEVFTQLPPNPGTDLFGLPEPRLALEGALDCCLPRSPSRGSPSRSPRSCEGDCDGSRRHPSQTHRSNPRRSNACGRSLTTRGDRRSTSRSVGGSSCCFSGRFATPAAEAARSPKRSRGCVAIATRRRSSSRSSDGCTRQAATPIARRRLPGSNRSLRAATAAKEPPRDLHASLGAAPDLGAGRAGVVGDRAAARARRAIRPRAAAGAPSAARRAGLLRSRAARDSSPSRS